MKKGLPILILIGFLLPSFVLAMERIDSFNTTLQVEPDSSINVVETIKYDFDGAQQHGIYRDIPIRYQTKLGNESIQLKDISVTDQDGNPYNFVTSITGDSEQIKIGDPNSTITGVHVYKINYEVSRAMGYFDTYDEIYWNTTGNDWGVQILASTATVILPKDVSADDLHIACYYGYTGASNNCVGVQGLLNGQTMVGFVSPRILGPSEGLTVAVGFPKGLVTQPSKFQNFLNFLSDNLIFFLPLLVFIIMFILWWKKGRDPKGSGVIVAEYDAPDGLTPLEVAGMLKTKLGGQEFSAEIIGLAVKGYLKITRIEEEKKSFLLQTKSVDYQIDLLKDYADVGNDFDKELLLGIFSNGSVGTSVKLSELKLGRTFYSHVPKITKGVYDSLVAKGLYKKNPQNVLKPYLYIPTIGIIVFYVFGRTLFAGSDFLVVVILILSAVIIFGFGMLMPSKTKDGALVLDKILGLKEYLQIAEKDRINFHDAPENNPEIFEKLLSYAMILGVEKAWAKEFEGIYTASPSWYYDPYNRGIFSAVLLTNSLNGFSSNVFENLASAPSHSSGSLGGGFSGGGFGGGGGGSW